MDVTIQKIKEIASCMTIFHFHLPMQMQRILGAKHRVEQLLKLRTILHMAKILMSISSKRKKNKEPHKPLFIITILIGLGNFVHCFHMWLYMFPGLILTSSDMGMLWHMPAWPHTERWCLWAVWATISSSDIWGQYFIVRHGLEMFY